MDGVRRWFRLRNVERDVDEEIAFYFDAMVRELETSGLSRAEARSEAERRFGDTRHYRREMMMLDRSVAQRERWSYRLDALRDVVRHAWRGVLRAPALALGIVLAFALGIGANATMYETVERMLLQPPPHVQEPDGVRRVVVHRNTDFGVEVFTEGLTYPDYLDMTKVRAFSHVAAYNDAKVTVGRGADAQEVDAVFASAAFYDLLGVQPVLGRFPTAEEDRQGNSGVAVLSHRYWQEHYGGSRDVIGQALDFGYGPYEIIGVAPPGFTGVDLRPVDFFAPFHVAGRHMQGEGWEGTRNWYWFSAVARLAPGAAIDVAEAEATAAHRIGRQDGTGSASYDRNASIVAAPLLLAQGPNAPSEVAVARWLLGVAAVVLLIACLNVANLLLARMIRQRREIAIRVALGISRRRLVLQIMSEGLLLGVIGGAAALLLTWWGGTFVQQALLPDVDWSAGPSRLLVGFVFALSLLAGLLSAVVPAWHASRRQVMEGLRSSAGNLTRSTARVRAGLSMVQAALSLVLLIGAGLFVRSLDRIRNADHGIDPWHVIYAAPVFFEGSVQPEDRWAYYDAAVPLLQRIDGVEAAASSFSVPFWSTFMYDLRVPGLDSIPETSAGGPAGNVVHPEYFRTMDIALRSGRLFDDRDTRTAPRVVLISEALAQALWPGASPLGRCIIIGPDEPPCSEVIGVVENTRRGSLVEDATYQYFMPMAQRPVQGTPRALLVRVQGDADRVTADVRRALVEADPRVRFARIMPMTDMVSTELRQWSLGATLFTLFGALALLVAAIGLYSVLAFDVAQRVREIGLRTALGASSRAIVALVVSRAVRITGAGIAAGVIMAIVLAPRLREMLYGVQPRDPLTFAVVITVLGAVSLIASGIPAWRAARVDPNTALRAD